MSATQILYKLYKGGEFCKVDLEKVIFNFMSFDIEKILYNHQTKCLTIRL